MEDLFEVIELDIDDKIFGIHQNLKVENINSSPSFYIILRSLIGNLKIIQLFRNEEFILNINYLNPKSSNQTIIIEEEPNNKKFAKEVFNSDNKESLFELITSLQNKTYFTKLEKFLDEDFTLSDLSEVLNNRILTNRNKDFYKNLLNEFLNFHYYTYKKNHTLAFLHLYRILEYISYSFPLLYAISSKDFSKSFDSLRTIFTGEKDKGELKVFKDFITQIFKSNRIYSTLTIDINIISDSVNYNERIYKTLNNICDKEIYDEARCIENSKFSINFLHFSSFIITIRNRFFHLKNSQSNNIHSIDIVDANHFFELINHKCAYFIGLITLEVIKKATFTK